MRREPPVRRDGKCRVCGKDRKPPTKGGNYVRLIPNFEKARKADPFCSTECCKKFHKASKQGQTHTGSGRRPVDIWVAA